MAKEIPMLLLIACLMVSAMNLGWSWYVIAVILYVAERLLAVSWADFCIRRLVQTMLELGRVEADVENIKQKATGQDWN